MANQPTSHHPEVQLLPVKSTNIKSVGYHEASSTLHVVFQDGGHYIYNHVPPGLYDRFIAAPSKGTFFHQNIKGKHQHTKVS